MATLYIIEQGVEVGCDGERLEVRRGEELVGSAPLPKVEDVLLVGNISITTPALKRLLAQGIPLSFLDVDGRYRGRLVGELNPHVPLRRAQYRVADDEAWALGTARACVEGKLRNARAVLQRFARNRAEVAADVTCAADDLSAAIARLERVTTHGGLLGVEGSATARYFGGLRALLDPAWRFERRARRPPPDPVNVLLSLGYTLLSQKVLGAVQAVGFDPYQGYLHRYEYNRPALALDLMEEFRPLLVDSLVLRVCGDGRMTPADFTPGDDPDRPVVLGADGLRRFLAAFEERMRTEVTHPEGAERQPGRVSYLRCLELQARRLARAVRGEGAYVPFTAR